MDQFRTSEMKRQVIYRVDVDYNHNSGRLLRKPIEYYIQDVLGEAHFRLVFSSRE